MSSKKSREELSGIHVVVIDDDEAARTIMKMVLEAGGAFVVVDLTLPAEDGYWFSGQLQAQRRDGGGSPPPAIAVSACGEDESNTAMRAGFDAFVPRPVDVDRLCEAIQRLANKKS